MITRAVKCSALVCLFLFSFADFAMADGQHLNPGPHPTGLVWGGGGSSPDPSAEGGVWGGKGGPHRLAWNDGGTLARPFHCWALLSRSCES